MQEVILYSRQGKACLANEKIALKAGLSNDAGRNAYLAMFHAAQGYIFASTGKIAKTHNGVRSEFTCAVNLTD